jgi:hypothetical protein
MFHIKDNKFVKTEPPKGKVFGAVGGGFDMTTGKGDPNDPNTKAFEGAYREKLNLSIPQALAKAGINADVIATHNYDIDPELGTLSDMPKYWQDPESKRWFKMGSYNIPEAFEYASQKGTSPVIVGAFCKHGECSPLLKKRMQDIADSTGKTLVVPLGRNVDISGDAPLGKIGPKAVTVKRTPIESNMTDADWEKASRGGVMIFRPNVAPQDTTLAPTQRSDYLSIVRNMLQKK